MYKHNMKSTPLSSPASSKQARTCMEKSSLKQHFVIFLAGVIKFYINSVDAYLKENSLFNVCPVIW